VERVQHEEKASLLWESFRDRLGQCEYHSMHFDMDSILMPINDLDESVLPFSNDEIDEVVSNLKNDKSPWLDGFNTNFMKQCWPIIKHDFYDL
jgi:hypothetical protein